MTESMPRATVLTAVYNGERWLRDSLGSVLGQDFRDFELLVVNDASSDGSADILAGIDDPRLVVLHNERNLGLAASLNRGLEAARGDMLLRHDADDVSLPGRFARQMAFMDMHPEVGVCGGGMHMVDEDGESCGMYETPVDHGPIVWEVGFGHAFAHPTVSMRTDVLRNAGGYDEGWRNAEDQELWTRLAWETRLANIPETLVNYRLHGGMASTARIGEQRELDMRARRLFLQRILGRDVAAELLCWNYVPPMNDGTPSNSGEEAGQIDRFAEIVLATARAVTDGHCETAAERSEVSRRAGRKLHALAAQAARRSSLLAARLLVRAVAHDPSLLSPSVLARTARTAWSRLAGGRS